MNPNFVDRLLDFNSTAPANIAAHEVACDQFQLNPPRPRLHRAVPADGPGYVLSIPPLPGAISISLRCAQMVPTIAPFRLRVQTTEHRRAFLDRA